MNPSISRFQQVIDAVKSLSSDEQSTLLTLLQKRLSRQKRVELVQEIAEVRQEYAQGNVKFGSVADFMAELGNPKI
jgi:predicted transcriptional regulator